MIQVTSTSLVMASVSSSAWGQHPAPGQCTDAGGGGQSTALLLPEVLPRVLVITSDYEAFCIQSKYITYRPNTAMSRVSASWQRGRTSSLCHAVLPRITVWLHTYKKNFLLSGTPAVSSPGPTLTSPSPIRLLHHSPISPNFPFRHTASANANSDCLLLRWRYYESTRLVCCRAAAPPFTCPCLMKKYRQSHNFPSRGFLDETFDETFVPPEVKVRCAADSCGASASMLPDSFSGRLGDSCSERQ